MPPRRPVLRMNSNGHILTLLCLSILAAVSSIDVKVMDIPTNAPFIGSRQRGSPLESRMKNDGNSRHFPHKIDREGELISNMLEFKVCRKFGGLAHCPLDESMAHSGKLGSPSCCTIIGTLANCSHCKLDHIPTNLPRNITVLSMDSNDLNNSALYPKVFAAYPDLRALSLSSNQISSLPEGVFEGLPNLKCLSLYNNFIAMDQTFNASEAFQPLNESLVYLKFNRNNRDITHPGLEYPNYALGVLTNLKYLFLDGLFRKPFMNKDKKFGNLTHLTLSGFSEGYCNIQSLSKDMFELEALTHLNISDCGLVGQEVDENAFGNLDNLHTLDITNNFNLGISTVGKFMYGLQGKGNFKHLIMERVNPRFTPCLVVYKETLKYFKNTSLEIIEAMNNEIEMVEEGALEMLPDSLKVIFLQHNFLFFGAFLRDLDNLKGLTSLNLDGTLIPYNFPLKYPTAKLRWCAHASSANDVSSNRIGSYPSPLANQLITALPIPPNLTNISMVAYGMAYKLKNITFKSPNKLLHADLHLNIFDDLQGPIKGLERLVSLNLGSCLIRNISYSFFRYFGSLRNLSLDNNFLGDCLDQDRNGSIFSELGELRHLNLSYANIFRLNMPTFKNLHKLKKLDMSSNRLQAVNFSMFHLHNLQYLTLAKNLIQTLAPNTRNDIDRLRRRGLNLRIDLSSNPILCNCENLEFLEWVLSTGILGPNITGQHYYCKDQESSRDRRSTIVDSYEPVVERLRHECIHPHSLLAMITSFTIMVLILVAAIMLYRFRWTLRYWYHAARLLTRGLAVPESFEYDVFVSYNQQDDFVEEELIPRLENEFNLRVLFHGLNFPAGGQIADSIQSAVSSSRKTLVVITKNMLKSYWCNYELMMARAESISRGHGVMVFLFLEDMSSSEMGHDIISYIRESTYIAYPEDPSLRNAFWRKLVIDLGARTPAGAP